MLISLIVAMDQKGVVGIKNTLPWRLSADLKYFKSVTMGKPIIMGRKTHESIGKPLPGRRNIVITRNRDYISAGCEICHNLAEALTLCADEPEAVVIGGRDIFIAAIDRADRIYLTEVHADVLGDTFFPVFDRIDWREVERTAYPADEKNEYPYSVVVLDRI